MLILTGERRSFKRKPTQEDQQQKFVGDMTEREKQQARKFWPVTLLLDSNISTPNLVPCSYFCCGGIRTSCMGTCLVNMVDEGPAAPHWWYLWGINSEQNTWFIVCWSRGTQGRPTGNDITLFIDTAWQNSLDWCTHVLTHPMLWHMCQCVAELPLCCWPKHGLWSLCVTGNEGR